ncbi:homeodomain-like protein [Tanacetum coccineum]
MAYPLPLDTTYPTFYSIQRIRSKRLIRRSDGKEEVVLFYNGLDVPTGKILDSRGAIPSKTAADAKTKQTTILFPSRLNGYYCEEKKGSYGPQFSEAYSEASHINNSIPRKEKDPRIFTLPCFINNVCFDNALADLGANVSVMPLSTYLNLGLGELAHTRLTVELADRTVKYPKGIAKNVLVELRSDQVDDLMPTIEEGKVVEEFRAWNDARMDDKMVYKGNNVVGAVMNVPIFVGTFSVVADFAVLENMDAYRDEGMGDVIVGEPFLREVGTKAKWFKVIITLYKNDDEATYQMVRSHPRFKNHTNEQCNKIPPLLKVSEKDEKNGISHAYQKLKGFYKGVLNLGPEYIRNAKTEEWLTRGHISVQEME